MDVTVNNNYKSAQAFGARLSYGTRRAIKKGIKAEYNDLAKISKQIAKIRLEASRKRYGAINTAVSELEDGTFSFYNELGLKPNATRIDFTSKNGRYRGFNLPEDIQNEIVLRDVSNIFVAPRYKITEFPAKRLNWLYNFFKNIKV